MTHAKDKEERFLAILDKDMDKHAKTIDPNLLKKLQELVVDVEPFDINAPLPPDDE